MSIESVALPGPEDIYDSRDLSKEVQRVLYLASLTDAGRSGAALSGEGMINWLEKLADDEVAVYRNPDERRSVVGMVAYSQSPDRVWVSYLAVVPTERGRGIGRALLKHAESIAGGNRPVRLRATPSSETYYTHIGLNVGPNYIVNG